MSNIIRNIPELTPSGFREWLLSKPCDTVIGRAAIIGDCPIANYLKEQRAYKDYQVMVFSDSVIIDDEHDGYFKMPVWILSFIARIDAPTSFNELITAPVDRAVTAEKAIRELDSVLMKYYFSKIVDSDQLSVL